MGEGPERGCRKEEINKRNLFDSAAARAPAAGWSGQANCSNVLHTAVLYTAVCSIVLYVLYYSTVHFVYFTVQNSVVYHTYCAYVLCSSLHSTLYSTVLYYEHLMDTNSAVLQ